MQTRRRHSNAPPQSSSRHHDVIAGAPRTNAGGGVEWNNMQTTGGSLTASVHETAHQRKQRVLRRCLRCFDHIREGAHVSLTIYLSLFLFDCFFCLVEVFEEDHLSACISCLSIGLGYLSVWMSWSHPWKSSRVSICVLMSVSWMSFCLSVCPDVFFLRFVKELTSFCLFLCLSLCLYVSVSYRGLWTNL